MFLTMSMRKDGRAMRKTDTPPIRRSGAYVVKAAESRPRAVPAKQGGRAHVANSRDRELVAQLLRLRADS